MKKEKEKKGTRKVRIDAKQKKKEACFVDAVTCFGNTSFPDSWQFISSRLLLVLCVYVCGRVAGGNVCGKIVLHTTVVFFILDCDR